MEEWEALIQRKQMLMDKISKMSQEIDKIDLRLDYLGRLAVSKELSRYNVREPFLQQIS